MALFNITKKNVLTSDPLNGFFFSVAPESNAAKELNLTLPVKSCPDGISLRTTLTSTRALPKMFCFRKIAACRIARCIREACGPRISFKKES